MLSCLIRQTQPSPIQALPVRYAPAHKRYRAFISTSKICFTTSRSQPKLPDCFPCQRYTYRKSLTSFTAGSAKGSRKTQHASTTSCDTVRLYRADGFQMVCSYCTHFRRGFVTGILLHFQTIALHTNVRRSPAYPHQRKRSMPRWSAKSSTSSNS